MINRFVMVPLLVASINVTTESEQTLIQVKETKQGWLVGPWVKTPPIKDEDALLFGSRAGWIMNSLLSVGGGPFRQFGTWDGLHIISSGKRGLFSTSMVVRDEVLHLAPKLPREMKRLDLRIRYHGHSLHLDLKRGSQTIRGGDGSALPITLCIDGEVCEFVSGTTRVFQLKDDPSDSITPTTLPTTAPERAQ